MSTQTTPRTPHAAPEAPANATATPCGCHALEDELRSAGKRLLDESKGLRAELAKQAQQHPLAMAGIAFAAGVLLTRALRR